MASWLVSSLWWNDLMVLFNGLLDKISHSLMMQYALRGVQNITPTGIFYTPVARGLRRLDYVYVLKMSMKYSWQNVGLLVEQSDGENWFRFAIPAGMRILSDDLARAPNHRRPPIMSWLIWPLMITSEIWSALAPDSVALIWFWRVR